MMINKMDHNTISSSPSLTNCRQTAGSYSDKSEAIVSRRRRTQLRRLKLLASKGSDDCKRRKKPVENVEKEGGGYIDFPHHSSVIGRRREMEDAVTVEQGFVDENSKKFDFYGVYDGHGGSDVAYACRERLHKLLAAEMKVEDGSTAEMNWEDLMIDCFEKMDEEVNVTNLVESTGSTAVVAVVGEKEIVVANCGDSRAVLSRGGATIPLSVDHKPDRPDELERIEQSGGRVIEWNGHRVLGVLATSRSIGDRQLKPYVIATPEVVVHKRDGEEEFMILGSDGLWDVMSSEMACHVVKRCLDGRLFRKRFQQVNDAVKSIASNAATVLMELAMARGSKDNISVIIVNLKDPNLNLNLNLNPNPIS